jgi:hypothetical protein
MWGSRGNVVMIFINPIWIKKLIDMFTSIWLWLYFWSNTCVNPFVGYVYGLGQWNGFFGGKIFIFLGFWITIHKKEEKNPYLHIMLQ